jgi:hypothetical protein
MDVNGGGQRLEQWEAFASTPSPTSTQTGQRRVALCKMKDTAPRESKRLCDACACNKIKNWDHGLATRWGKLQDLFYFAFKMTNLTMKYIHDDKAVCSSMHLMTPDSQQYIISEAVWILITNTWTSRHVSVNLLYRTARQTLHMVWAEQSEAPRFYSSAI